MSQSPTALVMNVLPAESEPEKRPKAPMRFTYASGTRPLEGYTIKRGVGRGGFGEVYFAVSDAGKEVALKLIRRNLDVELRGVTQCLNLKHPNLIALYDIRNDQHEDRWVVMEYVSGESLEDAIDRHPQGMPTELALQWFSGIAAGVAYLHDHGIVHRDLKPANIFSDEETVKIGDYGLSKFISCSRRSGQTESVGTVHYMAPEIANGRYGREIDTYALGIILYEMLTGHVPFEGESVGEVLMKHLTAEPDLEVLNEPFRSIVRGAMAKDPDTRIKSVVEMLSRLPQGAGQIAAQRLSPARPAAANGQQTAQTAKAAAAAPPEGLPDEAAAIDEEPILASIQAGWQEMRQQFRESQWHPLVKAIIGFVVVLFLVASSPEWLPTVFMLGIAYLVYRLIRSIVVQPAKSSGPANAPAASVQPNASAQPARREKMASYQKKTAKHWGQSARRRRQNWQQRIQTHVAARTMRDRLTELAGAMLVAAGVSAVAALLICLLMFSPFDVALWAWMASVATLASWAVMIPTKLTEGRLEDRTPLRFAQLVLGAVVGLAAWGLAQGLMLPMPVSASITGDPSGALVSDILDIGPAGSTWKSGAVQLSMSMFVAYFAFLFVLLAWHRQTEFARSTRMSLWSVTWCGLIAYLLHFFCWFPQPIGLLVSAVAAFSIQLSSPWMPPSQRRALAEAESEQV